MSKWIPTNSNILDINNIKITDIVGMSNWCKDSFIVGEGKSLYAVLPIGNKMCIVHEGKQLKICRDSQSARNFIDKHQKRRKK